MAVAVSTERERPIHVTGHERMSMSNAPGPEAFLTSS